MPRIRRYGEIAIRFHSWARRTGPRACRPPGCRDWIVPMPFSQTTTAEPLHPPLRVVGLFAGIGGIEVGLDRAGHSSELLCEIEDAAAAVLSARFPSVPLDSRRPHARRAPRCDLVAAGFPCQDLSQAGRTAGIGGRNSGLVKRVFELLEQAEHTAPLAALGERPIHAPARAGRRDEIPRSQAR